MHCYQTFAAITVIANAFEVMPQVGHKLPYAVVADWMEQQGIEPEDVLYASPEEVKAKLISLLEQNRPPVPQAA